MNLFDIEVDGIYYYVKDHKIPEDALPIIEEIVEKLKEIERWVVNDYERPTSTSQDNQTRF